MAEKKGPKGPKAIQAKPVQARAKVAHRAVEPLKIQLRRCAKDHVLKAYRIVPPKGSAKMRWYCEEGCGWQS